MEIRETNSNLPSMRPIKEIMGVYIDNVNENIPRRNGFVYALVGSGGSGKSSLLLNMFKSPKYYRGKFDNIFLFVPSSSFSSVEKHPFENHDKVYHELNPETLDAIYEELMILKSQAIENGYDLEKSLIIIDDFASSLKENELITALNIMIVKTRHLNCCWIFTLQAYNLFPKVLRKQLTNVSIFKPKNNSEWFSINSELLNMKKDNLAFVYNYCFSEPYNHLDIDTVENNIYRNFNKLDIIEK